MKKKFTILMFSLLLAVGWTTVAHAQLKAEYVARIQCERSCFSSNAHEKGR